MDTLSVKWWVVWRVSGCCECIMMYMLRCWDGCVAIFAPCTAAGLWIGRCCMMTFWVPGSTCVSVWDLPEKCNTEQLCSQGMWPCKYVAKMHLGLSGHWVTWHRKLIQSWDLWNVQSVCNGLILQLYITWVDHGIVMDFWLEVSICMFSHPWDIKHCLHAVYGKPSIQGQHSTGVLPVSLHEVSMHCVMYVPVQEIYVQVCHTYAIISHILLLLLTFFCNL